MSEMTIPEMRQHPAWAQGRRDERLYFLRQHSRALSHTGWVTAIHDSTVDVEIAGMDSTMVYPNLQRLPGLKLQVGYRVEVTSYEHDACVTAVIGFDARRMDQS